MVVCGLSGTGKSTVSRILQYHTGFEVLNSDRVRKRIAGVPETEHLSAMYGAGIYHPGFDRLTYDTLLADAGGHLREGRGVILDATFKRPKDRHVALATGFQLGVPVLFVECRADQEEVLRRLRERTSQGSGPSDATEDVFLHQRSEFAPLNELSARQHLVVDSSKGTESLLPGIENSLRHLFDRSEGVRVNNSPDFSSNPSG